MTPEEIQMARSWLAGYEGHPQHPYDRAIFALARIGLRVVDPSPEDVERSAQALVEANGRPWNYQNKNWTDADADGKEWCRGYARAALQAIAEGGE
jgi:hypothetical protein